MRPRIRAGATFRREEGFCGGLVEAEESGADLVGGGWVEFAEDGLGLQPGFVGGIGVAVTAVYLAEVGEGAGFSVAVAELPEQVKGLSEAVDGLGLVTEVLVGVAEA